MVLVVGVSLAKSAEGRPLCLLLPYVQYRGMLQPRVRYVAAQPRL